MVDVVCPDGLHKYVYPEPEPPLAAAVIFPLFNPQVVFVNVVFTFNVGKTETFTVWLPLQLAEVPVTV